jgi:hypothetical protein
MEKVYNVEQHIISFECDFEEGPNTFESGTENCKNANEVFVKWSKGS